MAAASAAIGTSPVLIGRTDELAALSGALERLEDGESSVVVVGGEAGIGKTRLIEEALERRVEAVRVLRGDCLALGTTIPYLPFAEMLRGIIRDLAPHEVATLLGPARQELGRFMPELAGARDASSPRPRGRADEVERLRLYEALLRVAERITSDRPTAFVLEDLQWIDAASLQLLSFLTHGLSNRAGGALVVSVRSEAIEERRGVLAFLADLERRSSVLRIELGPLGAEATSAQLGAILGRPPSEAMTARIHRLGDGNPLFTEELLAAAEAGRSDGDAISPKLRDLIAARLVGLSDSTLAVLRVAAAAGRTIDEDLLAAASGIDRTELEPAVRSAIDERILVLGDGTSRPAYRFRHEITRRVVAAQLLPAESARIHAAYAQALADEPAERRQLSEIAVHWDEAGRVEEALAAHVGAAVASADAYAFDQAREHYERALALWALVPDAEAVARGSRAWLTERAAAASAKAGAFERAVELDRLVIDIAGGGERELFEQARSSLRWYLWESGRPEDARIEAEAALADEGMDDRWRANALAHLAGLQLYERRIDAARSSAEQAAALASSVGVIDERILADGVLGWCLLLDGEIDDGLDGIRRALAATRELDSGGEEARYPVGLVLAQTQLASALELVGRLEDALEVATEGARGSERLGVARTYGSTLEALSGRALYALGRWDEAATLVDRAIAAGAVGSGRLALLASRMQLETAHGRHDAARATASLIDSYLADSTPLDVRRWIAAGNAELDIWQGRSGDALTRLAPLSDGDGPASGPPGANPTMLDASVPWLLALGARASADLALEERATASEEGGFASLAAERVASSLRRIGRRPALAEAWKGELALARAELERGPGRATARRWSGVAREVAGRPYLEAYAHWREAEAVLGRRDGREKASPLIEAGLELTAKLGAKVLEDELRALARRAGLAATAGPEGVSVAASGSDRPFGLTERELEVLTLVADGLSNQEIADQLFISPKTASVHVSNIYGKLGVESRVAAATTAHALGLGRSERG